MFIYCVVDWHSDKSDLLNAKTDIISITLEGPGAFCFGPNKNSTRIFLKDDDSSKEHWKLRNLGPLRMGYSVVWGRGHCAHDRDRPGAYATQDAFQ